MKENNYYIDEVLKLGTWSKVNEVKIQIKEQIGATTKCDMDRKREEVACHLIKFWIFSHISYQGSEFVLPCILVKNQYLDMSWNSYLSSYHLYHCICILLAIYNFFCF